jgi:outer membrane protein assembly factor BamA
VLIGKTQIVSLNYTRERNEITTLPDRGSPGAEADVAHVTLGYYNDRRDNIFDPGKGFSISGSIQHAARFLGSDYPFIRYSGQFDFFLPATPRLTWATSLSVGLVDGLGKELSPAEKFFASGRGTIRGFSTRELGPVDAATGQAIGGDAILVFRQELRWQVLPLISLVGFSDWGNVFARATGHNVFKLRRSAGLGIRLHFQPLLIRLDWGVKLDRRPGEKQSSFYFGIGHMF